MTFFYGISMTYDNFLVYLMKNDPVFQKAVLAFLHDTSKDEQWRRDFENYDANDVIGDITGNETGKSSDMQCYDFLIDATIDRVTELCTEKQPSLEEEPHFPMSLFQNFDVERDLRRDDYRPSELPKTLYIGKRLQCEQVPLDLHSSLLREFPNDKPGFILGY